MAAAEEETPNPSKPEPLSAAPESVAPIPLDPLPTAASSADPKPPQSPSLFDNDRPFAESAEPPKSPFYIPAELDPDKPKPAPASSLGDDQDLGEFPSLSPIPGKRPPGEVPRLSKPKEAAFADPEPKAPELEIEVPKLKLGVKAGDKPQNELGLDTAPRGRFEGENPNVFEGEDLDLPPFLRKKK